MTSEPRPTPVPWDEARTLAHEAARPLAATPVPLADALGSVLARPLVALAASPRFDASAMDGFAVRGTPPWMIVGQTLAGQPPGKALRPGQAREIATGAPLPAGTSAVLPYERATQRGSQLTGDLPARPQIRWAGEECAAGEEVLPAETIVTPAVLGLAAAVGHDQLWIRRGPRMSALVTGDELSCSGIPGDGMVRDAIGPTLPGLVEWIDGWLCAVRHTADTKDALADALSAAQGQLVLVSGSSAAGPADQLRSALQALGAECIVTGVSCRPGHPQSLSRLPDGRLIVGLPGNPFAALVAFLTLAVPASASFRGLDFPELATIAAPSLRRHPTDTTLVPIRRHDDVAVAVAHAGSAMLRGVATADALAVVPPESDGGPVRLLPLPGHVGSRQRTRIPAEIGGSLSR
jgi:molybdopterin molybdotransferase